MHQGSVKKMKLWVDGRLELLVIGYHQLELKN